MGAPTGTSCTLDLMHARILMSFGCHGLRVYCMAVIWPGFLGECVLSRDCLRRMGRENVSGARGREKRKQECGSRLRCWSLTFLLSCC